MPLKENTKVALDVLLSWMKDETPDDRVAIIHQIDDVYCIDCGDVQDKSGYGCNCSRDD